MKKLMMTAAALALMAAGAGKAMAADQAINIGATVTSFCTIGGSTGSYAAALATIPTSNGNVTPGVISVAMGDIVCNNGADVKLSSSNGAVYTSATAAGFQNFINYTATTTGITNPASVTAGDIDGSAGPAINGAPATNSGAFTASPVGVNITPTANSLPLIAGAYSDVLTLTVTPL